MRRTPLSRHRTDADATRALREASGWDEPGECAVCPQEGSACESWIVDAHHVLPKKALKSRGFQDLLWSPANRLLVCRHRHEQHESRYRPIPRSLVPVEALEFAEQLGLTHIIDRLYGENEPW